MPGASTAGHPSDVPLLAQPPEVFGIQYSVFSIQYSVFSIQYSVFSIWCILKAPEERHVCRLKSKII